VAGDAEAWDRAATAAIERPYLDPEMAAVKRRAHLDLLRRWLGDLTGKTALKTDLWEEGVAGDELLFTLAREAEFAWGVDVSPAVVEAARRKAIDAGVEPRLEAADLRDLPFEAGAVDAVVSTSTIDHLEEAERRPALLELRRVLAPGGVLVITCDNSRNVGDPLMRLANRLGRIPFPLAPGLSLAGLRELVADAGFQPTDEECLVHGPRMVTTLLVRGTRLLSGRRSDRAARAVLRALERAGRRFPERSAAFVAVRAVRA
jgi:SAM-dependent methyltransferase